MAEPLARPWLCPGSAGRTLRRGYRVRSDSQSSTPLTADVTGPRRRLGQLSDDQRAEPRLVALEGPPCGVVPPQAVIQHRARVRREADQPARTALRRHLDGGFDQLGGFLLPAHFRGGGARQ